MTKINNRAKPIHEGTIPIRVAREVVGHLSFGIYKNFARAVRELISNAYDGKATEVRIGLDLRSELPKVIVRDDGVGMNITDMKEKLFRIGTVTEPTDEIDAETARKRIGQFGIGFLSTFPYCESLTLVSKKGGEDAIVEVKLETARFFKGETFDITQQEVAYKVYNSDLPTEKGETIVTLERIKPHIVNDLRKVLPGRTETSIDRFQGFEKFKWSICQFAPLQYPTTWKELLRFFSYRGRNPLRLWLDGNEVHRNVPEGAEILESGEEEFHDIRVKYVIMSPMKPVQPQEARGLQVRVRDVGIDLPTEFDVVKLRGKVLGKLNHICGEIHVVDGIVPIMIDRDSLSYTASVASMQEFFRDKLTEWNDKLETWASEDKVIYSALEKAESSGKVVHDLRTAGFIHYPIERLRMPKKQAVSSSARLLEVLEKRAPESGYQLEVERKASGRGPALIVLPKRKVLIVRKGPPGVEGEITVMGRSYTVRSEKWDYTESLDSACRISGRNIVFNTSHPIFDVELDEQTVRMLVSGINLILEKHSGKKRILVEFYRLLKESL